MAAPTLTSTFVDVYGVAYNGINIFGVSSISVSRNSTILLGQDNNKKRPVASHEVAIAETVTINTEDGYALIALAAMTGAHDLTFSWKVADQTLASNALSTKSVTIKNVVWENKSFNFASKAIGSGSLTGRVLEVSDDTDPIVFA